MSSSQKNYMKYYVLQLDQYLSIFLHFYAVFFGAEVVSSGKFFQNHLSI